MSRLCLILLVLFSLAQAGGDTRGHYDEMVYDEEIRCVRTVRRRLTDSVCKKCGGDGKGQLWGECSACYGTGNTNPWKDAKFNTEDKFKGKHIKVHQNGKTAEGGSCKTVRAGAWVPRDGTAAATFKVDRVEHAVRIGVLTERYSRWEGSMWDSPEAWSYTGSGKFNVYHAGKSLARGPRITAGSEVTVSLSGGEVTFSKDGTRVHSLVLPPNCGRISLGVTLWIAKVTIV